MSRRVPTPTDVVDARARAIAKLDATPAPLPPLDEAPTYGSVAHALDRAFRENA